jgi:hypothetical protein
MNYTDPESWLSGMAILPEEGLYCSSSVCSLVRSKAEYTVLCAVLRLVSKVNCCTKYLYSELQQGEALADCICNLICL